MKFSECNPPRCFSVGDPRNQIVIRDTGTMLLCPDEQVTFVTDEGKEYDVVRKSWGFYATPSTNGRLAKQGFKTAIVENLSGMRYVMLIDQDKKNEFEEYCKAENQKVIMWLDEETL